MKNPRLISLIVPFYKGERFIIDLLKSVFDEKYENLEVLIINDGSPKQTLKSLTEFQNKITVISQENHGQAAARNLGLKYAKGSVIGFLDQDDLWPKGRINLMLPYLVSGEYDFVRGLTQTLFIEGSKVIRKDEATIRPALIGSALYRAEVFQIVGGFDDSMRIGEDFDWNIRLNESGCREKRISEITLLCRKHEANQSDAENFIKDGQIASIRKKLQRAKLKNLL